MSLGTIDSIYFQLVILCISVNSLLIAEEWTTHESFENNDFNGIPDTLIWSQSGNVDWTIDATDALDGTHSARSGVITHNQTSSISTSAEIPYLPGSIEFSYKTSTEASYDKLIFYVNGVERAEWDGLHEWADTLFVLQPSNNTYIFKWEYFKDGNFDCTNDQVDDCEDAVWVDNINITGHNIVVNAGEDIIINEHDAINEEVEFDGTNTYPDEDANLSIPQLIIFFQNQMKWYDIDDLNTVLATGPNPTISLDCTMDEALNMCVGEYDIVLRIAFGTFEQTDTVHVSIAEPNQSPILTASSFFETVYILNDDGIPGPGNVHLISTFGVTFSDSDDAEGLLSLTCYDINGDTFLNPFQNLNILAGDYIYDLTVTDPYGSNDNISLNLTMTEENEFPTVTIAANDANSIGIDQNSIENQEVHLFGFVEDGDNDVDGSTSTTQDDLSYLWACTQEDGTSVEFLHDMNILNTSFTAPTVNSNSEIKEVTCTLQAADPFQTISGSNTLSDPISITVYNDNQPPTIDIISESNPSIDEDSLWVITLSELISNGEIEVFDEDGDNQEDFILAIDSGDNYSVDNLTVTPDPDYYGGIIVPIRVSDEFDAGGELYNNLSEQAFLIVDVVGINDAPVLVGPFNEIIETVEDTDVEITGISVSDVDIGGIYPDARLQFDLDTENGTFSLNSNTELYDADNQELVSILSNDDGTLFFTARPESFNDAVSTLIFHPAPNYFGPNGKITIIVNDQGNFDDEGDMVELMDTLTISINTTEINDIPSWIIPDELLVMETQEDESISIVGIELDDDGDSCDVTISSLWGTIDLSTYNGLAETISDSEDGFSVNIIGRLININTAFSNITYTPDDDFNGEDTIIFSVVELGVAGDTQQSLETIAITVESINDLPSFSLEGLNHIGSSILTLYEDFENNQIIEVSPDDVPLDEIDELVTYSILPLVVDFVVIEIDENSGEIEIGSILNKNGFQEFKVTANDGVSESFSVFSLEVEAENDPPYFELSNSSPSQNEDFEETYIIDILPYNPFYPPEDELNQTVIYRINPDPDSVDLVDISIDEDTGIITIVKVENGNGIQSFSVTADDSQAVDNEYTVEFELTIEPVNDAPEIFPGSATLESINEDETNATGNSIQDLFNENFDDSADEVIDGSNANNLAGIIIESDNSSNDTGVWQYSFNGGLDWENFEDLDLPDLLLEDKYYYLSADTYIRFNPNVLDWNGSVGPLVSYLVDDSGEALNPGEFIDLDALEFGGNSKYSEATVDLSTEVLPVNNAPIVIPGNVELESIDEDNTDSEGNSIQELFNENFDDSADEVLDGSDANILLGVVIAQNNSSLDEGIWQYLISGESIWSDISPTWALSQGLFLSTETFIRFNPASNYNGSPGSLRFHLMDDSSDDDIISGEVIINVNTVGGSTTFSESLIDLETIILPLNDDPTIELIDNINIGESSGPYIVNLEGITDGDPEDEVNQYLSVSATIVEDENDIIEDFDGSTISYNDGESNGTLTLTPIAGSNGAATIEVRVDESEFEGSDIISSFSVYFIAEVNFVNLAPNFSAEIDTIFVLEDSDEASVTYTNDFNDGNDGVMQTITFNLEYEDSLLFSSQPFIDEDGELFFTVAENMNGIATVKISLIEDPLDGGLVSEESTLIISIQPVNDAPSFELTNIDNLVILEDAGIQNSPGYVTNIDHGEPYPEEQTLTFELLPEEPEMFEIQPTIHSSTGTLSFKVATDSTGIFNVGVVLHDNGGTDNNGINQTDTTFFNIEVSPINDAPSFVLSEVKSYDSDGLFVLAGNQNEDSYSVAEIIVTPDIPPNDEGEQIVIYSLSADEAFNEDEVLFANLSINDLGTVTINPITNGNGHDTFTITANDGGGGDESYTQNFTYSVIAVNDAPVNTQLPEISGDAFIDSLLTVSDGIWNDDLDEFFSSGSSEITYAYRWYRADDSFGTNENPIWDEESNEYLVTQMDFHKFLRAKIIATDNGPRNSNEGESTEIFSDYQEIGNTRPISVDDNYTLNEDNLYEVDFDSGLLKGWSSGDECVRVEGIYDSDCDRDGDQLTVILITDVQYGVLTLDDDGSFSYMPGTDNNFESLYLENNAEVDDFTYSVFDGTDLSDEATVELTINPINDAPIFELKDINDDVITSVDVYEDFPTQYIYVSPGLIPSDEMEQVVEYVISSDCITSIDSPFECINVDISIDIDTGEVTIKSNDNKYETVELTVTATDGGGTALGGINEYSQSFVLDITAVNDPPSFTIGNNIIIIEDEVETEVISWASDISRGPSDEINQDLFFQVISIDVTSDFDDLFVERDCEHPVDIPDHIITTQIACIDSDGTLQYTLGEDKNGLAIIKIRLWDTADTINGGVDSTYETQSFTIDIIPVNDPPSFVLGNIDELEINEDGFENENGLTKSISAWTTKIEPGPLDEDADILTFHITSSKEDSTIFSSFPQIDEESGNITYSINPEFNGKSQFIINLSDNGGVENGGDTLSIDKTFSIWVRQINDTPELFAVHPRVFDYAIDTTTFYFDVDATNNDTTNIFYRLPYQVFAPPEQPDSLLRFSWEKASDIDTDGNLNFDSRFDLYYRLEAIPEDGSKIFVLKDDIVSETVSVDIDMTAKFPVYTAVFNHDYMPAQSVDALTTYILEHLDTTGVTEYSWRVTAQNYTKDYKGNDPVRSVSSDVDLKIDLELPSAEMAFFQSELYSEYYDLYFITNEETIDSVARVWIDVDAYTQNLLPSKMGDSLYHVSSTFVSTGMVNYNFQVRDKRLNLGRSLDSVNYEILIPELARTISSPDNVLEMYVPENAVEYETPVIISVSDADEELSKNNVEIISREYQIAANSMILLKPAILSFILSEGFTEEMSYKYKIVKINDNNIEELGTQFDGESLLTSIMNAGNYAVAFNSMAIKPLPEKFALGNIYPNPFNPSTTIEFALPDENIVLIDIYNIRGQHIRNLLDVNINPGYYSVVWSGLDNSSRIVPSGIYFVNIKFANQLLSKKVTFLK